MVTPRGSERNIQSQNNITRPEKAPKIAAYTPQYGEITSWDDAVTMVLTYAKIPLHHL
jgi:hypothetical protein